jgi:predicted PurR-regulated permease PerM
MKKNNITEWLYWFSLAVATIIVYKFLDNFSAIGTFLSNLMGILMPFIIGILIAYILYIPCKKVEESFSKTKSKFLKKKSRTLSIFTVYLIIAIIIFILVNVILPPIIVSVSDLLGNLPGYYKSITDGLNNLPEDSFWVKINSKEIINKISSIDFEKYLSPESITGYIKGIISVASGIFDIFVTLIISIYTLADRERILGFLKKLTYSIFKKEKYLTISKYAKRTNEIFFNFISGQIIDAVIVGIITTVAMTIMKVKYAALLGFLIGLFNLIPFFGAIVAVAISIFITICTGGIGKAIWLAIVVIILQQIDANIINPKILGDKLEISPMLVIFSVTLIGAYFGVLGMFLAVPIMAMLKLIINDYLDYKISINK